MSQKLMTVESLQQETLELIGRVADQLRHPDKPPVRNAEMFISDVLWPLEVRIRFDRDRRNGAASGQPHETPLAIPRS